MYRAIDKDLTAVGFKHAGEDLHQRGLARSVLPQEPDDLSRPQLRSRHAEPLVRQNCVGYRAIRQRTWSRPQ